MKTDNKRNLILLGELLKIERDGSLVTIILKNHVARIDVYIGIAELTKGTSGEQVFWGKSNASSDGLNFRVDEVSTLVLKNTINC